MWIAALGLLLRLAATGQGASPATQPAETYSTHALTPLAVIDAESNKQYINSVCVTAAGTWLISVTSGSPTGHFTYTRRSTDHGRTWESRVLAYDAKDAGAHFDAEMGQLLALPRPPSSGGTHHIYQFHVLRDTRAGTRFGRLVFTISKDDGRTWTGPNGANSAYPVETPAYALAPGRNGWHLMAPPVVLSTGEMLLPLNVSTDPPALQDIRSELVFAFSRNIFTEPDPTKLAFEFHPRPPHGVKALLRSDPTSSLAQEPQVVELSDGRLMCVMRTGNGSIYYTVSGDHGRSWRPAEPLRDRPGGEIFRHPNAPCPFTRLTGGRYALLFCDNDGTAFGGRDPFDHLRNRQPVFLAIGRELAPSAGQPLAFSKPRLLCGIDGFRPDVAWRDLTYGFLLEYDGGFYHFYNAVWQSVQVNRVDPALTRPEN